MKFTLPIISAALLFFAMMHVSHSGGQIPLQDPPHALPDSLYGQAIAAIGIVEPDGGIVEVGTPLPGVVAEVFVHPGQTVKQDAPLFRLDDRHLQAARASREAGVVVARAKLAQLESPPRDEDVAVTRARLQEAQTLLVDYQLDLRRSSKLFRDQAVVGAELEQHQTNVKVAEASVDRAQAGLKRLLNGPTKEELAIARSIVTEAEMQRAAIEVEIERLIVRAPFDVRVLRVNVRPTESVTVSTPEPLVLLARLGNLHVRVDIAEDEIARYSSKESAHAVPRGDVRTILQLKFVRIEPYCLPRAPRNGPVDEIDSRVVQVIYRIDVPAGVSLYVGQQLDAFFAACGSGGS